VGVERVGLEHHRDVAVLRREPRDVAVADRDPAAGDVLEPGDHAEQRRLATTGRAHQYEEFAVSDVEGDIVDSDDVAIRFGDVLEPNRSHGGPDGIDRELSRQGLRKWY
jgi:hypothetical protein